LYSINDELFIFLKILNKEGHFQITNYGLSKSSLICKFNNIEFYKIIKKFFILLNYDFETAILIRPYKQKEIKLMMHRIDEQYQKELEKDWNNYEEEINDINNIFPMPKKTINIKNKGGDKGLQK